MSTALPRRRAVAAALAAAVLLAAFAVRPTGAGADSPAVARAATPVLAHTAVALRRSCKTNQRALTRARQALRRARRTVRTRAAGTSRRRAAHVVQRRAARVAHLRGRARRACRAARAAQAKRPAPVPAPTAAPAAPRTGTPTWADDFDSANWDAWDDLNGNESLLARYFSHVADPAGGPGQVFKATVDANAVDGGEAGQRALATLYPSRVPENNKSGAHEGSEQWYRARIYFPTDFVPARNTDWNWVLEWHNWPDGPCCANLAITVDTDPARGSGERLTLRSMGGGSPEHPVDSEEPYGGDNPTTHDDHVVGDATLDRGRWYEVVMHVKWSWKSSEGLVEWWLDGRQVLSRQTSTLYWYSDGNSDLSGDQPGPGQAYIQAGYYRDKRLLDGSIDTSLTSVYHDDYRRGPTLASIS